MSATPKSNYSLQDNKIVVRLNLNIPLEFEIDLQTMSHAESNQFNQGKSLNSVINANSDLIIDKIKNADFDQKIKVVSNETATEILDIQNPKEKSIAQIETNILNTSINCENHLGSNQEVIYNTRKRIKISIADSLNDSFTMAVNLVGTMLFLGKLANYSWE
ncbi:hypothetical protein Riv7116_6223 [Rivularia sp. PCC 7116]|uniref:hypothetical protein n=1 Tax=Rivularia sp. PCC 7116 TaxID=373994 RepID=UPI00029EEDF7|nr:hypothetical protein [Rivularia sp. PCC 7116]AFY58572.1 hypothetical protein Riv7116_6223 [Rivularia sp. PCC 7116]